MYRKMYITTVYVYTNYTYADDRKRKIMIKQITSILQQVYHGIPVAANYKKKNKKIPFHDLALYEYIYLYTLTFAVARLKLDHDEDEEND